MILDWGGWALNDFNWGDFRAHVLDGWDLGLQIVEQIQLLREQHLQTDLLVSLQQSAHTVNLALVHLLERLARVDLVLHIQIICQLLILLQDLVVQELH